MKLNNESKELAVFLAVIAAAIGIFSAYYFGLAGLKVFIGIILASLPFYIFLNTFRLDEGEKFILSLIFGVTLFPSFAYLLGFFVPFRISIAIVFAVLIGISFAYAYLKSKKK
ncbi:hypothetical protein HY487_00415 [Candidatus Woesearchaeota archaeon]|nr:hypothetical protein [Candidatus Woesearchaeota archaeon]